jgi:hypothetical protein
MTNPEPTSPPENRRPVERDSSEYPLKPLVLAERVKGTLSEEEKRGVDEGGRINWRRTHLHLANPDDVAFAAEAIADGKAVVHAFGNFNALSFHPDNEVMKSVNAAKGRPLDQVASVATTKTHISGLFDWDSLPEGFTREQVMRMINRFYDKGPFGFRGPAAEYIPSHLTTVVAGVRTVQVIAPGYHCTSNEFLEAALERCGKRYLGITSANVSSHETGKEEPAHFKIKGAKKELGSRGFVMLAHGHGRSFDEWKARRKHRDYSPTSVSILGFYKQGVNGGPTVTIDRHGSLPGTRIFDELGELGVSTVGSRPDRIGQRTYHPRLRRAANLLSLSQGSSILQ